MKLIFMGTPDYAACALRSLISSHHEVLAVVTQPDRKKGRGMELVYSPVKEAAMGASIPVLQPANVNEESFLNELAGFNADIFVVAAFGQILKKPLLELPPKGCINIHASLLPKLRGAAPIQKSILDGDKETGVTIMKMDVGLDTGDMISKSVIPIEADDTGESLHNKLSEAGALLIVKTLDSIADDTAVYEKQDDSLSTYAGRLEKSMGRIDWTADNDFIERQIRAFYPWPGAYTALRGKSLKVIKGTFGKSDNDHGKTPGEVIAVYKDSVEVAAGKGSILLKEVIPEGKKQMEMKAFLNGYSIKEGEILG